VGDGNKEVSENKKDDVCEEEVCEEGCWWREDIGVVDIGPPDA
jgi:hypothetical protein